MRHALLNHSIFVDECGFNIWTTKSHGQARMGEKAYGQVCGQFLIYLRRHKIRGSGDENGLKPEVGKSIENRAYANIVMASVSDDCVFALAIELGENWRRLGTVLGLENKVLARLSENYKNDACERAYRMLRVWQQKKGSEATYQELGKSLRNQIVRRVDLAEKCENGETWTTNGKNICVRILDGR